MQVIEGKGIPVAEVAKVMKDEMPEEDDNRHASLIVMLVHTLYMLSW
jgi:hypothetical protein